MSKGILRYATIIGVVIMLGLVAWYWVGMGNPFRKPVMDKDDMVLVWLSDMLPAVEEERWDDARQYADMVEERYRLILGKLQFFADRGELRDFEEALARLTGALEIEEKTEAYLLGKELITIWTSMANP